jgi:hypothetical protein
MLSLSAQGHRPVRSDPGGTGCYRLEAQYAPAVLAAVKAEPWRAREVRGLDGHCARRQDCPLSRSWPPRRDRAPGTTPIKKHLGIKYQVQRLKKSVDGDLGDATGVLVGAALPGAVRIGEIDCDAGLANSTASGRRSKSMTSISPRREHAPTCRHFASNGLLRHLGGCTRVNWSRLSEQLFRVDKWSVCRG